MYIDSKVLTYCYVFLFMKPCIISLRGTLFYRLISFIEDIYGHVASYTRSTRHSLISILPSSKTKKTKSINAMQPKTRKNVQILQALQWMFLKSTKSPLTCCAGVCSRCSFWVIFVVHAFIITVVCCLKLLFWIKLVPH